MQVLNIFHVLVAIAMVALVLVQRGAGATAGAAFGSGASGTVFGSRGAGNFLTRSTWILATLFCAISLTMAVVVSRTSTAPDTDLGVISSAPAAATPTEEIPSVDVVPSSGPVPQSDVPQVETSAASEGDAASADVPAFNGPAEGSSESAEGESAAGEAGMAGSEDPDADGS